jgi:uncharacterized Tic20 family protein
MSETIPPFQPINPTADQSSTRAWEVLCHLSAAAGFIVPFGNIIGPLIVWLVKRGESLGVDAHGKESLNFQISWTIYGAILGALTAALWIILIGFLFVPVLIIGFVAMVILTVIGAVKASNGQLYRYPLTIRFLK